MKRQLIAVTLAIALIGFIVLGVTNIRQSNQKIEFQEIELKSNEVKLKQLNEKYDQVLQEKTNTEQEKQDHLKKIDELEKERQRLEAELQAKREKTRLEQEKLAEASRKATATPKASASAIKPVGGKCNTGNPYKDFIYYKESSCNPGSVNSIGCRGIGQACPGTKLPCGNDFACQDAWFSNYAIQRYGSWESAYNFWLRNNWW